MAFNFGNYVRSGQAGEAIDRAVSRAVAEARAAGLRVGDDTPAVNENSAAKARTPQLSAAISRLMASKLEEEAAAAGAKLRASVARPKTDEPHTIESKLRQSPVRKGQSRAA